VKLFLFPLAIYAVIFISSGLIMGGDSRSYLNMAQQISHGDFSFLSQWPMHWMYPGFLSFGYLIGQPMVFATVFNLLVLAVMPVIFYRICQELTGWQKLSYWAGVAIIFQVYFIFWALFVLTDSLFITLLAVYILTSIIYSKRGGKGYLILLIMISLVLIFTRPSAIITLPVAWGYILYARVGKKAFELGSIVFIIFLVSVMVNGQSRDKILSLPTVYQSLWLGTRTASNNVDQITEGFKYTLPEGVNERDYKLAQFKSFVADHPLQYAGMCFQRLAAYWMPWIWGKWDWQHKSLEFVYSLYLLASLFIAAFWRKIGREKWLLISMAVGFSLLTVFGQIDSDIRYRLPAELCTLLLSVMVLSKLDWKRISCWLRKSMTNRQKSASSASAT
jgi:hypothetical protein